MMIPSTLLLLLHVTSDMIQYLLKNDQENTQVEMLTEQDKYPRTKACLASHLNKLSSRKQAESVNPVRRSLPATSLDDLKSHTPSKNKRLRSGRLVQLTGNNYIRLAAPKFTLKRPRQKLKHPSLVIQAREAP